MAAFRTKEDLEMSTATNGLQETGTILSFPPSISSDRTERVGRLRSRWVCSWYLLHVAGVLEEPISQQDNEATQKAKRFYNSCTNVGKYANYVSGQAAG